MPIQAHPIRTPMSPEMQAVFRRALGVLLARAIPFSIGGALAVEWYSGIWRAVKDLDLYLVPEDVPPAMAVLRAAGFQVAVKHPEWLVQAFWDEYKVELVDARAEIWQQWARAGNFPPLPPLQREMEA